MPERDELRRLKRENKRLRLERPPSVRSRRDDELRVLVRRSWQASLRTYGRPRIHTDLKAQGKRTSPKRIARIMREEGIASASRRRGGKAAVVRPDADARPASGRAWLYVAVVVDAWSLSAHGTRVPTPADASPRDGGALRRAVQEGRRLVFGRRRGGSGR